MSIEQRADRCWDLMGECERAAVNIGMSPLWTTQQDLGGKAPGEGWIQLQGDEFRLLILALMNLTKMRV